MVVTRRCTFSLSRLFAGQGTEVKLAALAECKVDLTRASEKTQRSMHSTDLVCSHLALDTTSMETDVFALNVNDRLDGVALFRIDRCLYSPPATRRR